MLVNTGDGKGKSTAAFGVMLRGCARGWKVAVLQFVKGGEWKVGEEKIGRQLGVDWRALGDGFTWDSDDLDGDKARAAEAGRRRRASSPPATTSSSILDELTYLCNWGWLDIDDVAAARSATGRGTSTS